MRPRPDAAENAGSGQRHAEPMEVASMRPRPDAAENKKLKGWYGWVLRASMRPRPDAAENEEAGQCTGCGAPLLQ